MSKLGVKFCHDEKKEDTASRFDAFFSAAQIAAPNEEQSSTQTSKRLDVQMSKSKNPEYQRTTVYMPKQLHRKFKAAAAVRGEDMSDIVSSLVEEYLQKHSDV